MSSSRVLLALVLSVVACVDLTPMVKSNLLLDGQKWVAARCVSTAREGFRGVDLTSPQNERIRIVPQPDDSATIVLFPADGSKPIKMTDCARGRTPPTGNGWAELACEGGGRKIEGRVEFERCH